MSVVARKVNELQPTSIDRSLDYMCIMRISFLEIFFPFLGESLIKYAIITVL